MTTIEVQARTGILSVINATVRTRVRRDLEKDAKRKDHKKKNPTLMGKLNALAATEQVKTMSPYVFEGHPDHAAFMKELLRYDVS